MLKEIVTTVVEKIVKDDVKELVTKEIQQNFVDKMSEAFTEVLESEKKKLTEKLDEKFSPLHKIIDDINVSEIVDIEDKIEEQLDQYEKALSAKVQEAIKSISSLSIDVSNGNEKLNEIISELICEIAEDDEDVEDALKEKLMATVKAKVSVG